jgi:hypothetical protein
MTSEESRGGKYDFESFIKSVQKQATEEGDNIETEEQLRLARGRQKIEHNEKRLQADLDKKNNEIKELETDRDLKKKVAMYVFGMLIVETVFLFVILLLQGFRVFCFELKETTLNIFVPATILQVSSMAIIITKYLFSKK